MLNIIAMPVRQQSVFSSFFPFLEILPLLMLLIIEAIPFRQANIYEMCFVKCEQF